MSLKILKLLRPFVLLGPEIGLLFSLAVKHNVPTLVYSHIYSFVSRLSLNCIIIVYFCDYICLHISLLSKYRTGHPAPDCCSPGQWILLYMVFWLVHNNRMWIRMKMCFFFTVVTCETLLLFAIVVVESLLVHY